MAYALENARFQWEEGERRLVEADEAALGRATDAVIEELRRRLGSTFTLTELADLYGSGTDWASDVARRHAAGTDATWVVDAAFARYAREASDRS